MVVRSWDELQERIGSIVERLNADLDLAVSSAVNPFFALEEIGLTVAPEARAEIEDRLRFPGKEATRRGKLRRLIFDLAGREFDIQSAEELHQVLFKDLSIRPYPDERGCYPKVPDTHPLPRIRKGEPVEDPLAALEGRHPIIAPLLKYRRLDARRPRFAPPSSYAAIRQGDRSHGIRGFRIRLKGRQADDPRSGKPDSPPKADTAAAALPLDVNTASAAELQTLRGIGAKLAARIVAYRKKHGPFETIDGLVRVAGISERLLATLRPFTRTET